MLHSLSGQVKLLGMGRTLDQKIIVSLLTVLAITTRVRIAMPFAIVIQTFRNNRYHRCASQKVHHKKSIFCYGLLPGFKSKVIIPNYLQTEHFPPYTDTKT